MNRWLQLAVFFLALDFWRSWFHKRALKKTRSDSPDSDSDFDDPPTKSGVRYHVEL